MSSPTDLRYTRDHEWVRVDGDEATVGITQYAADQLGDIVFVELPDTGRDLAPPRYDFGVGVPDASRFPAEAWRRQVVRQLRDLTAAMGEAGYLMASAIENRQEVWDQLSTLHARLKQRIKAAEKGAD